MPAGLGHPFDIGWALTWGAYVVRLPVRTGSAVGTGPRSRSPRARAEHSRALEDARADGRRACASSRSGHWPRAISSLQVGIDGWRTSGGHLNLPYLKSALAEALARAGDLDAGLHLLDECLEQIERPGWHERVWLAETLRLKGWVLMRQGKRAEAEAQLRASLRVGAPAAGEILGAA